MKKIILVLLAFFLLAGTALAKAPPQHPKNLVCLMEKTSVDGTIWTPAPGIVGFGCLTYRVHGPTFSFNFKGFNLLPETEYSLIYYPSPLPDTGLKVLAAGTSNKGGKILLKGDEDTGTLPTPTDENFPGARIWLVPSNYIYGTGLLDWPSDPVYGISGDGILFETALINYYVVPAD